MLYKFLVDNREALLAHTVAKADGVPKELPTSAESERGLPDFYAYLIQELKRESRGIHRADGDGTERKHGRHSPLLHGQELSRLGYTVSQVVHGYGSLCQAITELAHARNLRITASEFSVLNLTLDVAIAEAVTGFSEHAAAVGADSTKRIGYLVHELRNALAAAIIAHSMVKKGIVGTRSTTSVLLERNLNRMRDLLDRSFSEVRMRHDKEVNIERVPLLGVIEEVEVTASEQARVLGLTIEVLGAPPLQVDADRHYLVSALSNLVQNAIKYSKRGGLIRISGRETDKNVVVDVEDECGGLPKGRAEELFKPFTQKSADRTGLGLGLTISRKAIALNGGTLTVQNIPGKGCVFSISLPKRKAEVSPESRKALSHHQPRA